MINQTKIVDFEKCKTCKYYDLSEDQDPCWDCLADPVNTNSSTPTKYEEAKK